MKTNKEIGIYKLTREIQPYLEQLEHTNTLDLTGIPLKHRKALGRIAETTGIIEYRPTIKKRIKYRIIQTNQKKIIIDTTPIKKKLLD